MICEDNLDGRKDVKPGYRAHKTHTFTDSPERI